MSTSKTKTGPFRGRWRTMVAAILGVVSLTILVVYSSPERILATIGGARFELVALAWLVTLCATALRVARIGLLVPTTGKVKQAYGVFSIFRLLNLAFPFRSGEFILLAMLKRVGISSSVAESIPAWAVVRLSDVISVAAWFVAIAGVTTIGAEYAIVGWVTLLFGICALCILHYAPRWMNVSFSTEGWLRSRAAAVLNGFQYMGKAHHKAAVIGLGLIIMGGVISGSVIAQHALNTPLSIRDATAVAVITLGLTFLPINSPLGIGTGDAIWTGTLVLFGVPGPEAAALAIGVRVVLLSGIAIETAFGSIILWATGHRLRTLVIGGRGE